MLYQMRFFIFADETLVGRTFIMGEYMLYLSWFGTRNEEYIF